MRFVFLIAISLFSFPATAMSVIQDKVAPSAGVDVTGIYITKHESGMIAPLQEGQTCAPPYEELEGGMCIEPYEAINRLVLHETPYDKLYFGLHLSFFNGHSCSVGGIANKNNKGWLFEEIDSANAPNESFDDCRLDITVDAEHITLNAQDEAPCRMYCGARGSLHDAIFPRTSKTDEELDLNKAKCLGWIEGGENCDQYNEQVQ